jgi:hypothetical protein
MLPVDPSTRVCPFCGERPGDGVFCAACGRNLAQVERLPTAAEWSGPADLAVRVAEATAAFVAAMSAAGNPGAKEFPAGKPRAFGRGRRVRGWVVRPVDREDFERPKRYEPGLLLAVDGRFHRLDSELRGWGQRNFPHYDHTASPEPVEPPPEQRLLDELAAVRAAVGELRSMPDEGG